MNGRKSYLEFILKIMTLKVYIWCCLLLAFSLDPSHQMPATLLCPGSPPPQVTFFRTCPCSPSISATSRYHFQLSNLCSWKIVQSKSQEINVLHLFLFWQEICLNPKSDFQEGQNWLYLQQFLADGTHHAIHHIHTPPSPMGPLWVQVTVCPFTLTFSRAGLPSSCSPK